MAGYDLQLLKKKVDLLLDGYQVLYMKLEQQNKLLHRIETLLSDNRPHLVRNERDEASNVVRLSERFLHRVRKNFDESDDIDPVSE